MTNITKNSGLSLIGILILGVILIFVLSYFKINIKTIADSPEGQGNINYVKGAGQTIWQAYLQKPVSYFWNNIFIEMIWKSFVSNMQRISSGQPSDLQNSAPLIPSFGTNP